MWVHMNKWDSSVWFLAFWIMLLPLFQMKKRVANNTVQITKTQQLFIRAAAASTYVPMTQIAFYIFICLAFSPLLFMKASHISEANTD